MSDLDYTIYYSRFHDESEAHAEQMSQWMLGTLSPYAPTNKEAKILDVGCGYGFALRAMRDLGFNNTLGLELSAQQAAICQRAGFNVEVTNDTAAWLQAHSGQFDFVMLLDVLEHVAAPEQITLLKAIHSCLRPGGRLYLTTPNANAILASRWRYNDYTHHSSFTEHSLYFVLKSGGFDEIKMDATKGIGTFPRRLWRRSAWRAVRKWLVRWCWLQVFKAELPWEQLNEISFELNLSATAKKL